MRESRIMKSGQKNISPLKVGLTGGAGSGKSLICKRLEELGVVVVSADILAREAVEPGSEGLRKVTSHFGTEVLDPAGALDRKKLRDIILRNPEERKQLEAIIHPAVGRRTEQLLNEAAEQGARIAVVEVPLLFEAGMEHDFDVVVTITADFDVRVSRLVARDRVTAESARALIDSQLPEEEKIRRSQFVLVNNGSVEQARQSAEDLYGKLMNFSDK